MAHQPVQAGGAGCVGIVRSTTVSSKLSSGKWPRPKGVASRIVRILRQWGVLQPAQAPAPAPQQQQPQQQQQQQASVGIYQRGHPAETADTGVKNERSEEDGKRPPAVRHSAQTRYSTGDSAAGTATCSKYINTTAALGSASSDEAQREAQHKRYSAVKDFSSSEAKATRGAAVRADSREGGPEEGGVSGPVKRKLDVAGGFTPPELASAVDKAGESETVADGGGAAGAETVGSFSLSVEDAFVEVRATCCSAVLSRAVKKRFADSCEVVHSTARAGTLYQEQEEQVGGLWSGERFGAAVLGYARPVIFSAFLA